MVEAHERHTEPLEERAHPHRVSATLAAQANRDPGQGTGLAGARLGSHADPTPA